MLPLAVIVDLTWIVVCVVGSIRLSVLLDERKKAKGGHYAKGINVILASILIGEVANFVFTFLFTAVGNFHFLGIWLFNSIIIGIAAFQYAKG